MTVKNVLYALAVVGLTVSMPNALHCEEAKVGGSQPATVGSSQPATTGGSQPATVGSSEPATVGSGAAGSGQLPRPYGFQGPGGDGSQPATVGESKEPTGDGSNPPTGEAGGK